MKPRLNARQKAPEAIRALAAFEAAIRKQSPLDRSLVELVKVRASQINGCASCLDLHAREARAAGETERRLYALNAWQEAPFFTDRERAALRWNEAITIIHLDRAPDLAYEEVRRHFSEDELVHLTMAIVSINAWNRLSIGFRDVPPADPPASAQSLAKA